MVWLFLGQLGLGPQHIVALALAIELPALILLVVLLRGHSTRMGLLALPIILSPSIALGFERGNIDFSNIKTIVLDEAD